MAEQYHVRSEGMAEQYYLRSEGRVSGPFDLAGLQKLVRRGNVTRMHEISTDRVNWAPTGEMKELFPPVRAAPSIRPAPDGTAAAPTAVAASKGNALAYEARRSLQDLSGATGQRSLGLVWVVFYWIITSVLYIPAGYIIASIGGAMGASAEVAGHIPTFSQSMAAVGVFLEFLGILIVHYGLLVYVACYGLWTFRKWALPLARGLAVANTVLSVLALVVSLVGRAAIVCSLVNLLISIGILVYLYGMAILRDRLQRLQRYLPAGEPQDGA